MFGFIKSWLCPYIAIIILCIIVYYLWSNMSNNKLYYFYKNNCTDCKDMESDWCVVENEVNKIKIKCEKIDIDNPKNKKMADNFNITKTPSIVIVETNGIRNNYKGQYKNKDILSWVYDIVK